MQMPTTKLTQTTTKMTKTTPTPLTHKRKPYVSPQLACYGTREDLIARLEQLDESADADQAEMERIRTLLALGS